MSTSTRCTPGQAPYLGGVPLASLSPVMLTELYSKLEKSGRQDGQGEGLSARGSPHHLNRSSPRAVWSTCCTRW